MRGGHEDGELPGEIFGADRWDNDVNTNLTIDGFLELLDFIEEPDEDFASPDSNVA